MKSSVLEDTTKSWQLRLWHTNGQYEAKGEVSDNQGKYDSNQSLYQRELVPASLGHALGRPECACPTLLTWD